MAVSRGEAGGTCGVAAPGPAEVDSGNDKGCHAIRSDNQQVNLTRPVPVVIVYLTAIVEENSEVYFYDDIYGLDGALNDALARTGITNDRNFGYQRRTGPTSTCTNRIERSNRHPAP